MSAKMPQEAPGQKPPAPSKFRPEVEDFEKMQKQIDIAVHALCKIGAWTYGHSPASREHKIYLHATRTIDEMYEAGL